MRYLAVLTFLAAAVATSLTSFAQPPREGDKGAPPKRGEGDKGAPPRFNADDFIARIMAYDTNKDGKISKDEATEERLQRMFERADADKDGFITKAELETLAKSFAGGEGGRPGPGGFAGRGPQPGQIMPTFVQEMLKLTDEQKKEIAEIQKDVEARIQKVLTDDQKKQLKEMRDRMQQGGRRPEGGERRPEGGERPPVRPAPPKD